MLLPEATAKRVNKSLLAEQIYAALFDLLVKNKLPPGTKLNIDGISKEFGVSRSPVASAFSALERDGFLKIIPQNGTFVRVLTREELEAIYQARAALEKVVAAFVVDKVDRDSLLAYRRRFEAFRNMQSLEESDLVAIFDLDLELHNFLSGYVPEIVRREYQTICNLTRRSRLLNLKHELKTTGITELHRNNVQNHIEIIDAILAKDLEKSARLLEQDVFYTKENAQHFFE